MKISERYGLNKSQAQLDFVDIDPSMDTPLFLDPFFLSKRKDRWSFEASNTIRDFFQRVIDLIRSNRIAEAQRLFQHLVEPNATCLGLSRGRPKGRGVGAVNTAHIFDRLIRSRAIQSGLIRDIEDHVLFVENFDKDRLSDMTTNIIRKHLIAYTQIQCELHGIPLADDVPSGFFWNRITHEWEAEYTRILIVDNKAILLVPKGIVSFNSAYSSRRYYGHFVLNFLQNEHLSMNSLLVERRKDGTPFVTKKRLEEEVPFSKDFLRRFTADHPEVLQHFKDDTEMRSLTDLEFPHLDNYDIQRIMQQLLVDLRNIPAGSDNASSYHNLMIGILEIIFYPYLINPVKEQEIHNGRKRIDIVFDNAAQEGVFFNIPNMQKVPCMYVFVECKNYSRDIANPELDQIGGRFSFNRGQVGFIVCRQIDNLPLFIERCRDTYRDGRGLIIPLVDDDIIRLLQNYDNWNREFVDQFLSERVRQIIMQ
jgi:hypothetical protein